MVSNVLVIEDLNVYYAKAHVLKNVSLKVLPGEFVSIIGPNGAGKTTLLRTISGLKDGQGRISFNGAPLPRDPAQVVQLGIIHCPEGRHLFPDMSVKDNLLMGAFRLKHFDPESELEKIYQLFPILRQRERQTARTLSGGEQQMLAIGRALMGRPELLLLDEPTLGLAPIMRKVIAEALKQINNSGVTILLAEQNVPFALANAHRIYLLETGVIVKEGTPDEFRADERVQKVYLGTA
ncbi:MAG: ABC transporter ATP-binding protein [Candidatus Bipolaricaulota bacterium]|nr:ABC transporter ATP-binding protein [Candidatus Bipolaricaulota bacterium]MDW8030782.1 ABC transporter ATP-binding protein [Candidatus Bipolaricaulota bacterium]